MPKRNEFQCKKCSCWIYNIPEDEEIKHHMEAAGDIECTQDLFPYTDEKCRYMVPMNLGKKKAKINIG